MLDYRKYNVLYCDRKHGITFPEMTMRRDGCKCTENVNAIRGDV